MLFNVLLSFYADMAELADALDSGSSDRKVIQVQVLLSAPKQVFITDLSYEHFTVFIKPLDIIQNQIYNFFADF